MTNTANNMATVAKTHKQKKKSVIAKKHKDKILRAYISLYNAFLLKNLMSGKTLGAASYSALQMVKSKIATMDKRNPVTKLLRRINASFSKAISKRIMTNKHRDSVANIKPEKREKLNAHVSKLFNDANAVLKDMSAQYKPKPKPKDIAKKQQFVLAQVKVADKQPQTQQSTKQMLLLQIYMRQQAQRQRAA